ncbi:NADPH:quinone reductase [Frankia sp. CcI49]|uniref:NADP-dependent oxidoreductase n=1 Tax=Frankia sp. CcI49 TaxID=1745382 RepID=UPI0009762176|nr:NADP-dependent oxidoreductase [Frankia sp. CcI49]ONH54683.1 NADPH:quinone reductase [Frankia sp. CcI49]
MKTILVHRPGPPRELQLADVGRPEPGPGEVLVRVHAAGVNPPDWYARSGLAAIPAELRPVVPFPFTPGTDVSGVVTATGPGVTAWAVGDEVFGLLRFPTAIGAAKGYAEYTTAPATELARKPAGVSHIEAAAVPMAGLTAWQFIREHARVSPGSTVLVNGAAGGVGHLLVQFLRVLGARVIAVASTRHEELLRRLDVDEYIDYTTTQATDVVKDVDVLFDTVGGPDAHRLTPAIRDGGVLSPVFYGDFGEEELARRGVVIRSGQVRSAGDQLAEIAALLDAGAVRVGIDSVFPLAEAWRAHERAEQGHIQGKIVLAVAE